MALQASHGLKHVGWGVVVLAALVAGETPRAQDASIEARRAVLDQVLDMNVRDGYVYYRALKSERAK